MVENRQNIRITDWVGLNTRDSDLEIPDGACSDISNIEFFREGWTVRSGIAKVTEAGAASKPVTGIFDGFNNVLVYCGTDLFFLNPVPGTWDSCSASLTDSAIPVFASYNGLDMFVNGSGNTAPQKWTASIAALGGSPPKADDICVWRNHVWLTGLASPYQDELNFSEFEDPEAWPGNFIRPSKRQKGANLICSRVAPFPGTEDGTRLMVFASNSIYNIDGYSKSQFNCLQVQPKIGGVAKNSFIAAEGNSYWLTDNGFYCSPDAGYNVNNISWNIQPTIDGLNRARLAYCCGVHLRYKKQIWWSLSDGSSSTNNIILVYNYGLSTPTVHPLSEGARHVWSIYEGVGLAAMAEVLIAGLYQVWVGDAASTGFVHQAEYGTTDNGTEIPWSFKTKRFLLTPSWSAKANLRKIQLLHKLEGDIICIDLYRNHSSTVTVPRAVELGALSQTFNRAVFDSTVWGDASVTTTDLWYNHQLSACQFNLWGYSYKMRCYEIGVESNPVRGVA